MGTGSIVVRGFEAVGLQDVSADPWGEGLGMRPTVHRVMRTVGVVILHVALVRARVVIVARTYFVTMTMLVARTIVMGRMGLVAAAVVKAGLVFVTLIVVAMMGCVLVMNRAVAIV